MSTSWGYVQLQDLTPYCVQRSSLFLVHSLQRRLLLHQLRIRTEAFDDEHKYVLTELGSPFKGLGICLTTRQAMRVYQLGLQHAHVA